MPRLTILLLTLVFCSLGHAAQAQGAAALFSCGPDDSQAQRAVNATLGRTGDGSVSDVLDAVHGTHVRQGSAAQPVTDSECQALVSALTSKERSTLADTRVTVYRIATAGRQPHVFAAYVWPILPDDPGVFAVGEDLIYVLDASDKVLFVTLAASSDAL